MKASEGKTSSTQIEGRKERSARTKNDDAADLHFATPDDWREIAKDLKLTKAQVEKLEYAAHDALMDIFTHHDLQMRKGKFKDYVPHLEKVNENFEALISALEKSERPLTDFIPNQVLEELGQLFSFSGISMATGKRVFPENLPEVLASRRKHKRPITMEAIERHYDGKRADSGLVHGRLLILHILRMLREPIRKNLGLQALDKGGRPPNINKKYMIERLVGAACSTLGMSDGQYADGPIVGLCYAVMVRCGFHEQGIEKEVLASLRRRRAKDASLSEPQSQVS